MKAIVSLVLQASLLVQFVMALLLLISLGSWTVIFRKGFAIRAAQGATDEFESEFWKDRDLGTLYEEIRTGRSDHGPLARIFVLRSRSSSSDIPTTRRAISGRTTWPRASTGMPLPMRT